MGINPDAYMSGAIPGLSRGGGWQNVQDPYPSPMGDMSQASPGGGSIFPRPSTIVPPGPAQSVHPGMGNRSNSHFARSHHPWAANAALPQSPLSQQHSYAPSYQQSYFGGNGSQGSTGYSASMVSGKAPTVGPTRHPGWTNLNGHYFGGFTSTPSSPSVRTQTHTATPPKSATVYSKHPASPYMLHQGSINKLPIHQQQEWEWASGSPKPMMPEPDYFSGQSPIQSESRSRPSNFTPNQGPAPKPMSLRLPSPKRRSKTASALPMPQPLPPPPQSGRLRHESMRQRPAMQRRHTHDRFSPEEHDSRAVKHDSKSLGNQRRREQRDVGSVAGESYYPLSKSSSMPKSRSASTAPNSPRGAGSRPATTPTPSISSVSPSKATSLTERRLKQAGRPALSTIASTVDFTSSNPSVAQSARPRPNLDMSELGAALPPGPITASPTVYTTSTEQEVYDRYTAHPAAPVPSSRDVAPNKGAPPLRMDVKNVKPGDYRPPCFPGPTNNNLKWNRDGPAMRSHGIPWAGDSPEGQLPTGPAGPRWAQARPPRLDLQHSGNWWESGVG